MGTPVVLIANRGEIAVRILRSVHARGWRGLAVYTEDDRAAPHVTLADHAVLLERTGGREPYTDAELLLAVAREHAATAVHPGYGFLSESAEFAQAVEDAGLVFIGPTPEQIRVFGSKQRAREAAAEAGVPLVAGTGILADAAEAHATADRLGLPLILKATGGGGGIGMEVVRSHDEIDGAFERVERLARHGAGGGLFAERYIEHARHIEVQVFGDGAGGVITLGDRDCTLQRRNQKVVEEAPAFGLSPELRRELHDSARALCAAVDYRSAGTVEFVFDAETGLASFLEVNTRLQVEHPVTETITGVDLVDWMLGLAVGETTMLDPFRAEGAVPVSGAAVESRVYAEEPSAAFRPSAGTLTQVRFPDAGARIDSWVATGSEIGSRYDPLLAKIITAGADRDAAWQAHRDALAVTRFDGIETNLGLLRSIAASDEVAQGRHRTRSLGETIRDDQPRIRVERPGLMTTVQDWPARTGLWHIGVPPSGPMDDLSFRLGNSALGNDEGAPGLEITSTGPLLAFSHPTWVCVTGAPIAVQLDGRDLSMWEPVLVPAGARLDLGEIAGPGLRSYLLLEGGLDVPSYLGSASTFTLGRFGGHAGRALQPTDVLRTLPVDETRERSAVGAGERPRIVSHWELTVLDGPHGANEFFTAEDIEELFASDYEVHFNSARTGVRLVGPQPRWARPDGGEAGLHPSNIHDTPYAIGALDFTGDTPVLLGPDGPSLGGFVCPVTVVSAERWKLGQLRPGDTLKFVRHRPEDAHRGEPGVLARRAGDPDLCIRRSGDDHILVEFGQLVLDLRLRARVHALQTRLLAHPIEGLGELTPGIRSLQIGFDSTVRDTDSVVAEVLAIVEGLPDDSQLVVPSRRVRLPLSWDDPATREAIARYAAGVRDDAPWAPWNIEFIRRINGLDSVGDVARTVWDAEYLVLGLGDVYLGAPVATPLDPRHRLVTTKYNPARTWTAENSVGIGGAYLCIYGMEGPGGYQLVGRTTQVWSRFRDFAGPDSAPSGGRPWLLDFFDRISWYPVSPEELIELRADMAAGRWLPEIEEGEFSLAEHEAFLAREAESIAEFRARQAAAFAEERDRWHASGEFDRQAVEPEPPAPVGALEPGELAVHPPFVANVWKVLVEPGARVKAGDPLVVLEAMKMEANVVSPVDAIVGRVLTAPGRQTGPADVLVTVMAE